MKPTVISPPGDDARELAALDEMFLAGLERYHVRKPGWSRDQHRAWLRQLKSEWHARIVLHHHHELVAELQLGGRHWRDDGTAPITPARDSAWSSRSCHDLATLRAALGKYDAVFFGPVFPSVSKAGAADRKFDQTAATALLAARSPAEHRTRVLALSGLTKETAPRALALGFDGVAVLGAIWQAADPVRAYQELQDLPVRHAA